MNNESKFNIIKDLEIHPGWLLLVESITELQESLKNTIISTEWSDINKLKEIQMQIKSYETLKNLPSTISSLYQQASFYNPDTYSELDEEYEKLKIQPGS